MKEYTKPEIEQLNIRKTEGYLDEAFEQYGTQIECPCDFGSNKKTKPF